MTAHGFAVRSLGIVTILGAVAGGLSVMRRRAGAWLLLPFLAWPTFPWVHQRLPEALNPV